MGILVLSCGLLLAAEPAPPRRLVTPEGWLDVAPDCGGEGGGTLTVVPAPPRDTSRTVPAPPPQTAPPAPPRHERPPCARLLERVLGRLTYLHRLDLQLEGEPVSPATRTALYPEGAAFANPNAPPIELGWDAELRDLFARYNRCLVHAER